MFFKSIDINNYGSITDFHYRFRFDKQGHPIPLVLIGENGSGKTLTIANMIDALIEIKRKTYGDNLFEVEEHNYFKIGSKNYITNGQNSSRVYIQLEHNKEKLQFTDIMSNNPLQVSKDKFIKSGDISNPSSFEEDGFWKEVSGTLKKKHYNEFVSLYFPVDRFYLPLWYNNENYKRIDYEKGKNINQPNSNIIKADVLSNIKEWLTLVYLQTTYQLVQLPNSINIPEEVRGKQVRANVDSNIQSIIKNAMNTILGKNDYSPRVPNRKHKLVSFSASGIDCKDISQLSEGQMSLFASALSIIKEWDMLHDNFTLNDICGCVIIDEADIGLHINYMYNNFPRVMRLFPNIQFIITTHSPFLIAGLSAKYGENIDIITMPEGIRIQDIHAFSEVRRAQELIYTGINQIRDEDEKMKKEIKRLRELQNKIVLYTEGTTDEILIKKAIEKLQINDLPLEIHAASQKNGKHNDDAIKKLLTTLQENPCVNNTVIGLFDRDAKPAIELFDASMNMVKLVDHEYVKLGEHIYAFALPVPHNRPEIDQISIEHYFTDKEIMTENEEHQRLFLEKEFYPSGNHIDDTKNYNYRSSKRCDGSIKIIEHGQNTFVTDRKGNGDFSLSKQRFAEAIRDDRSGFAEFDFSEFRKIFAIIRKIITEEREEHS